MDLFWFLTIVLVVAFSGLHQLVGYLNKKRDSTFNKYKAVIDKLAIVDQYAYPIVASIAVNPLIPKSDSLAAAVKIMQGKLQGLGITNVSDDTIKRVIEAAYQNYKANGGKTNVAKNNVPESKIDAALGDSPQSQASISNSQSTNESKGVDNNG